MVEGDGPRHVVVDSTGVKVYGEGEWKVRQHGYSKRRTWRKLHLGVDESTGEILAAVVSTNNVSDDEAFGDLLDGIEGEIEAVSADGAYDKRKCYDAIEERGADAPYSTPRGCPILGGRRGRPMPAIKPSIGLRRWVEPSGNEKVGIIAALWLRR